MVANIQRYLTYMKSIFTPLKQSNEGQIEVCITMLRSCGQSMSSSLKHNHTLVP